MQFKKGQTVTFEFYGETRTGTVDADQKSGIVWIKSKGRRMWMHQDSLKLVEVEK